MPAESEDRRVSGGVFATTHWSVVLSAGESDSPQAHAALEKLCQTYWYPIFVYVRRRGYLHEDTQDLVQGFFAQLINRESLRKVSPLRGRFRSFILASLNYFLADQRDRALAAKRGSGQNPVSFDAQEAADRYKFEPIDNRSPEKVFEQRWALTILEQALKRLEQEYRTTGKGVIFEELSGSLVGDKSGGTYADIARRLNATEGAMKMAVSRLRQRYRELVRAVIAETVSDLDEVERELEDLQSALS